MKLPPQLANIVTSTVLILVGLILACVAGEALIRLGTANQKNYVIEMWRYATLLKRPSADPAIGHEHIPNRKARLQGVEVSINSLGMRGPEPNLDDLHKKRIVIIGDSAALGWGLSEAQTLRAQLASRLGDRAEVLNTGVGNMNLSQIVARWLHYSKSIRAEVVVVMASPRAPEIQHTDQAGWLVRHSELFALAVSLVQATKGGGNGRSGLVETYQRAWTSGPGAAAMQTALNRLADDQKRRGYQVIVVQIPESHEFNPYRFGFMTEIMKRKATSHGWRFVDPLPALRDKPAKSYWVSQDDIHLNGEAYRKIADQLVPNL